MFLVDIRSSSDLKIAIVLLSAVTALACGGGPQTPTTPTPTPTPIGDANGVITRCPTPAEVAASDRDLTLTFENDPTIGRTVCSAAQSSRDLTLLQAQVYRVLTVMRRLTFDAPLPWTSNSLYGWVVSSIHGIRLRGDIGTSFCCDPAGIIDIQTQNSSALQFPSDFRWVGTLMVLFVHEARHNNGTPYIPHDCPDGVRDKTIAELGAWGVRSYMNLFLANHSDLTFITPPMRTGFMQDAFGVCSARFCDDRCP